MNNISFRISNVFGCNQKYNLGPLYKSHGVQYNIFESLVLNKPFEIYGSDWNTKDGTLVRDFLHVDDVVDAIISSITWLDTNNGSHFMNLSSGVGMSLNELKSLIESTLSVNINMIYAGRVPAKPDIRILDNSLIKSKLAWKCKRDYNDAIRSMFQWYTGNIFKSICYS
jgi:UDP-glucose 4-epimerase